MWDGPSPPTASRHPSIGVYKCHLSINLDMLLAWRLSLFDIISCPIMEVYIRRLEHPVEGAQLIGR